MLEKLNGPLVFISIFVWIIFFSSCGINRNIYQQNESLVFAESGIVHEPDSGWFSEENSNIYERRGDSVFYSFKTIFVQKPNHVVKEVYWQGERDSFELVESYRFQMELENDTIFYNDLDAREKVTFYSLNPRDTILYMNGNPLRKNTIQNFEDYAPTYHQIYFIGEKELEYDNSSFDCYVFESIDLANGYLYRTESRYYIDKKTLLEVKKTSSTYRKADNKKMVTMNWKLIEKRILRKTDGKL